MNTYVRVWLRVYRSSKCSAELQNVQRVHLTKNHPKLSITTHQSGLNASADLSSKPKD